MKTILKSLVIVIFSFSLIASEQSEDRIPSSAEKAWFSGPDLESTTWYDALGVKDDQSYVPARGWAYQLLFDGIEPLYGTPKVRDGRHYLGSLASDLYACHMKTNNLINPRDNTDIRIKNELSRQCKGGVAALDELIDDITQMVPEKGQLIADLQGLRADALNSNIYGLTEKDIDERKAEVAKWRAKSADLIRQAKERHGTKE